jgi:hypothetical protein
MIVSEVIESVKVNESMSLTGYLSLSPFFKNIFKSGGGEIQKRS